MVYALSFLTVFFAAAGVLNLVLRLLQLRNTAVRHGSVSTIFGFFCPLALLITISYLSDFEGNTWTDWFQYTFFDMPDKLGELLGELFVGIFSGERTVSDIVLFGGALFVGPFIIAGVDLVCSIAAYRNEVNASWYILLLILVLSFVAAIVIAIVCLIIAMIVELAVTIAGNGGAIVVAIILIGLIGAPVGKVIMVIYDR